MAAADSLTISATPSSFGAWGEGGDEERMEVVVAVNPGNDVEDVVGDVEVEDDGEDEEEEEGEGGEAKFEGESRARTLPNTKPCSRMRVVIR